MSEKELQQRYYLYFLSDFIFTAPLTQIFTSEGTWELVFSIVNDSIIEGTESFTVSLTNPQPPDAVLALDSSTIFILDNNLS